jgi:hypothetical protein
MRARLIVPVLLLLGCSERDRHCEHARDVMLTMWEQSIPEMVPRMAEDARARFELNLRAALERARGRFLPQCLALPPEGQACIARIDELAAAARDHRTEMERCPKAADGSPDPVCVEAARERADQRTADCQLALAGMFTMALQP